jgi:hypothetical protein
VREVIPFRIGDVLLVDVPRRGMGPRTCRGIVESFEGDTVRVVLGSSDADPASESLRPGLRTWAGFQHDSGVFTMAATVAARVDGEPVRLVLRIPERVARLDDRRTPRLRVAVPLHLVILRDDGVDVHDGGTDDVGPGGFSCAVPPGAAPGTEVGVTLALPDGPLEAAARLVTTQTWGLADARPRGHFAFLALGPADTDRLAGFVARGGAPGPV